MPLLEPSPSYAHQHDPLHPMLHQQQALGHSSALMDASGSSSHSCSRSSSVDTDLEILDRELNALDASMPIVDPEITQGAEQLEKAISRKRSRSEEDNDRLVEALSQFYCPNPRLISGIDDCPLLLGPDAKRSKTSPPTSDLLDFELSLVDHNQNQKEFDVIMDALRLSTGNAGPSTVATNTSDSCGQAAMMSEAGVFHNLVVASLET